MIRNIDIVSENKIEVFLKRPTVLLKTELKMMFMTSFEDNYLYQILVSFVWVYRSVIKLYSQMGRNSYFPAAYYFIKFFNGI